MLVKKFVAIGLALRGVDGLLRFSCSQLVTERLDPIVFPGVIGSPHVHQVIGGNAFNATMRNTTDPSYSATCTTCTFSQDFSNYWTATLYYAAKNGTFKRIKQIANAGFDGVNGGSTVYYTPSYQNTQVTAFKSGFRMTVGNPTFRNASQASKYRQLTYTCLYNALDRTNETVAMPTHACNAGIMANVRFPTCWDGVNLDTANHQDHVAYPASGTFESGGPCPSSHPVKIPQLFYETVWDTTPFNAPEYWPKSGQPFVWSFGDFTGYGNHGDYVFGWKGNSLQEAMDANCDITCSQLTTQSIAQGDQCTQAPVVNEPIDGWLTELPGNMTITGPTPVWD